MKALSWSLLLSALILSSAATTLPGPPRRVTATQVARHEAHLAQREAQTERRDARRDTRYTTRARRSSLQQLEPRAHRL